MSFESIQTGPRGRTVELYEFFQEGVFTRVTSAANNQTASGNTYETLAGLSRTSPVQSNESRSGEIEVTVPISFPLVDQFRGTLPSSFPELTIYKLHLNDPDLALFSYWKGVVVNCAFNDDEFKATLFCLPPSRVFDRPVPRAVYSGLCNHQLYDAGCKVVRNTYAAALTILAVDASGTTLTVNNLRSAAAAIVAAQSLSLTAQEIDDFWQRGLITSVGSPVEHRMVVQTDVGNNPDVVRINIPFRNPVVGQSFQFTAGCAHNLDFCNRKFNNAINFGGFPYVPTLNPFEIELDSNQSNNNVSRGITTRLIGRRR